MFQCEAGFRFVITYLYIRFKWSLSLTGSPLVIYLLYVNIEHCSKIIWWKWMMYRVQNKTGNSIRKLSFHSVKIHLPDGKIKHVKHTKWVDWDMNVCWARTIIIINSERVDSVMTSHNFSAQFRFLVVVVVNPTISCAWRWS